MKQFSHLTLTLRKTIGILKKNGLSQRKIARAIGVHPTTISRELKRNYCGFGYCCRLADDRARGRRVCANRKRAKIDQQGKDFIADELLIRRSLEQIASLFPLHLGRQITHQSIYRYLQTYDASRLGLRRLLRRKGKRYIKHSARCAVVKNRPCIDSRPVEINDRSQYGHWEADLMDGPRQFAGALLVLVERKSRYVIVRYVTRKTSALVSAAIVRALLPMQVTSITYDNGVEFASYKKVAAQTGSAAYFCNLYHSWEKGTVENTIGLLREYHPKKRTINFVASRASRNTKTAQ